MKHPALGGRIRPTACLHVATSVGAADGEKPGVDWQAVNAKVAAKAKAVERRIVWYSLYGAGSHTCRSPSFGTVRSFGFTP